MRRLRLADLDGFVGAPLGASDWLEVTQDAVDRFAVITRDEQWIHVDPARASAGPFGGAVAHGYLVLSLCTSFINEVFEVSDAEVTVNYGLDRVRFPAPTHVGARIRGVVSIGSVDEVPGGRQAVIEVAVEREDAAKPVCVANVVGRYLA